MSVTQPSLPSAFDRTLTLVRLRTVSSLASSRISRASPGSSFRMALPSVMSKVVVMAMLCLQMRILVCSRHSRPPKSFKATQPDLPSLAAFTRTRCASNAASCLGPSRTSRTSPALTLPSSLDELSKASWRGAPSSSKQQKYGFEARSKKGVPWLPVTVSQPSFESDTALHRARSRPEESPAALCSRTSTSSPTWTFRTVLLSLTSNKVVMAISLRHVLYSWSMSMRVSLVMPAATASMLRSSCAGLSLWSGIFCTKARSACGVTALPSFASSLKSASALVPLLRMWTPRTCCKAFWASSPTCFRAAPSRDICFLAFRSISPTFTLCFTKVARASLKGPLTAFLMLSVFSSSLMASMDFSARPTKASKSFSASSKAFMGSSLPAPLEAARACAADITASALVSASLTVSLACLRILSAAWRSMASWRRFFSASIAACCFFLHSTIVLLNRFRSD
mmetsp:Transcript_59208/g.171636  ORF Transcript_59208/g.171636 Transcript_59208/m.171636 type:complete len:454 (+) Transcript_59208:587-1948(+)